MGNSGWWPRVRAAVGVGAVLAAAIGLAACDKDNAEDGDLASEGAMAPGAALDGPLRRIQVIGPAGGVPEALQVRLTAPMFGAEQVGGPAGDALRWTLSPAVEVEAVVVGVDVIELRPKVSLRPGTEYQLTVTGLQRGAELLSPPEPDAWSHSFRTPDFGLLRASPRRFSPKDGVMELDLRFTGAVRAEDVLPKLELRGPAGAPIRFTGTLLADGRTLRLSSRDPGALVEGPLQVSLAAGVPYAEDGALLAPAATATLTLSDAPPVEVLAVMVKEGLSGFYFEVVCKDPSAGEERWYWDRDSYESWYVHERCMPDADAIASAIQISPAVPFMVTPGPAGFRIMGEFSRGVYDLSLGGGLRTIDGGQLPADVSRQLGVPRRASAVEFVSTGRYLPRSAWRNLAVRTLNVDKVEVEVRHVPPENLVFWLSGAEQADARTSVVLARTEVPIAMREDQPGTHYLDLASLVPNAGQGVYEVTVRGGPAVDAARLVLTDHQIIAKRGQPSVDAEGVRVPAPLWLWVRDVHTGGPSSGVELKAVRPSGQVLGRCLTGGDGHCALAFPADPLDSSEAFAIIAQKGADLTFLRFEDLLLQSDAETQGEPWSTGGEPVAYRAGLYTDRGVYRPGETVHLAGVLRDGEGGLPEALPRAVARFIDARGSELRRVALTPDANGHFTADLGLADFAATGRYHARLEVADRPVGELSFNVEEFVPERMAVSAKASAAHVIGPERATFAVEGRWLFGGSASGSAVEASCRVEPARFSPPGAEGWHFGAASVEGLAHTSVRIGGDKGVLDAEGKASVRCAPATEAAMFGSAQVVAELAVLEGGSGRATRTTATVPVHPAPLYIGLRSPKAQVRRGQELAVEGRLVDLDGKDLSAGAPEKVEVEVFRLDEEVGWFWDDGEGSGQVRRSLRRVSEGRRVLPVSGGRFTLRWPGVSEAAGWLVVATGGGARTELFLEGDANRYAWWDGEQQADQTPRPARPTPMALTAPDQVEVGEDFEVTATAPYAGWVLWTVESDRVLTHRWEKVEAGPIRITPEVEEFTPNVYVSAFLIKDPHLESAAAFLPGRSYGARSVRVRPEAFEQSVKIEVAAEARPFAPLEVKLDLGRLSAPATATVAIVDEGVLQITRFETPNPLHRVFARRQLGVESFETVGWTLMMEPGGPSSRTGGDGAGGSLGRVQLVKPVALWSGPVTVGVDGKATVKVDLPGYRGKLRVMAVASAGAKLGSAEASVVVRDPIVIQTTPPRVLATGDEVEVPVFVSNQTGKDVQVEVKLAAEALAGVQQVGLRDGAPPVRVLGADHTTLNLKVGQSDVAVFRLRSDAVRGAARLRVTASGGGEQSRDELDVPLVPARAEEHRTVALALADMVDVDAALDAGGWIDGADRTQIIVTDNPYAPSLGRITDLVRYPYGCIEQTVSSTRPLLALRALMPGLDADLVAEAPVDARVKAGIDRVLSMQTPSGGFAYWPGGADAHAWGTAYATHLLLDAKDARFDVPQVALDEALTYLERSGLSAGRPAQDSGAAYAHYVLARGGRARAGEAQRLLEQLPADGRGQVEEARTLLMAAVQLTGDRRHEGALRKPAVPAQLEARSNDWTFYSELRRAGLLLNIVEDLFPGDKGSEALAQAVAEAIGRRDGRWYTTQELAWAVSGLGKRVSASGSKLPPVVLAADGKELAAITAPTGPVWALNGASAVADLALRAPGAPAQARVLLRTHGVRAVPEVVESSGLRLERVALTTTGGAADLRSQALGDRLFVKMSVENLRPVEVPNLAVVGRLPAGWEVESARVPVDPFAPEGQEALAAWSVDHVNVRDDRIELFGTLPAGQTRTVWLELRATSAGRFTWPGMTAEAMYDPNVWARLPSSQVEVRGPWTGSVL